MSTVKAHSRLVNGHTQFVHAYDDKRKKGDHGSSKGKPRHIVDIPDPGAVKMKDQITEWLRTEDGRKEFEDKIKVGGFQKTIPEVVGLYGVEQGAHHPILDAFDHTMEVIRKLPADASDNQRWAALLHDIGKPHTQRFSQSRGVVFDGHEYEGYKRAIPVLKRLGFGKDDSEEILHLIKYHGSLRTKLLNGDEEEAREFLGHKHFDSLLAVHTADVKASARDPKEVLDAVAQLKLEKPKKMIA